MRHSCLFVALSLTAVTLAGCGPDSSSGGGYLNPAADVDLAMKTFRVQDTEGLAPVLQYTAFRDFYRGIEPANEGEDNDSAMALREHLDAFLGATPNEEGTDYTSVRNPLDLINEVIRTGAAANFNEGRRLMRDSIEKDEAASYNTPANSAQTRFTETEGDASAADSSWIYVMLDWTYNPAQNKVYRATQFVARSPAEDDENPAEVASASWSGRYNASTFGTSGFNQPEYAATSYTGRTLGNAEFLQEFIGTQRDTLTLTSASGLEINDKEPDCVKVELNYERKLARVFTSKDEPPTIEEDGVRKENPQYCGYKKSDDEAAVRYDTVTIAERQ